MLADLPYIHAKRTRHGKMRYYFRRKGYARKRLPGAPGSPEFAEAYSSAMNAEKLAASPGAKRYTAGSISALVAKYERSAEFNDLAILTRREMGYVLRDLVRTKGDQPAKNVQRRHIALWRDAMQAKPGAANKMVRTLKVLMSFAVDRGYRTDNPVTRVKLMKLGSFRPWTPAELAAFESRWTIGTLERLGYSLALYLGQRRADLVSLTYANVAGGLLRHNSAQDWQDPRYPDPPGTEEGDAGNLPNRRDADTR